MLTETNSSLAASKIDAIEMVAPDIATIPTKEPEEDEHKIEYIPPWQLLPVFVAMGLAILILGFDNTILGTATPSITDEFRSLVDIGWYGSAYRLTACPTQFFYSKLYEQFQTKWILIIAVGILELGSIVSATAPNSAALIAGRVIAGLGASGILVGVLVAVSHSVPLRWRPLCNGAIGGLECIAMVVAPVIGGALTTYQSWRWCFWINLPLGGFTMIVIAFFFKNSDNQKIPDTSLFSKLKELNIFRLLIFSGSVVSLLLAVEWGGTVYNWSSGRIISLFMVFSVSLGAFIAAEMLGKGRATIPSSVILNRTVALCLVYAFCSSAAYNVIDFYLPIWFQAIKGASAVESGVMLLPSVISISVAVISSGFFVSAIGYYTPLMLLGSTLMAIGYGFLTAFTPSTGNVAWIGWQVMFSIGFGFAVPQPWSAPQTVLSQEDIPAAIGTVGFVINISATLSISISQTIFTNLLRKGLADIPGIDANDIIDQGATRLLETVPASKRDRVLRVYNFAVTRTFHICVAASCVGMVAAICMKWNSVKDPPAKGDSEDNVESKTS